jgi:hypothetical protein
VNVSRKKIESEFLSLIRKFINIGKPNNLKFGVKKTKGHKQDIQNWLTSLRPEGKEP